MKKILHVIFTVHAFLNVRYGNQSCMLMNYIFLHNDGFLFFPSYTLVSVLFVKVDLTRDYGNSPKLSTPKMDVWLLHPTST